MRVPNHIAIILDGNGRWAKKRGMPRSFGHVKGCENLEDICEVAKELGVKYLTVYAFSTENWKRSKEEVDGLMKLFRNYLKKCIRISQKNNMRVKVIGDITAFDSDIQEVIDQKLAVVDLTASILCMENKMPMLVFGLNEENSIIRAAKGEIDGTKVLVD